MPGPSVRLLRLLALLQARRFWTGGELAERLEKLVTPQNERSSKFSRNESRM